jgi:hypothetical protein
MTASPLAFLILFYAIGIAMAAHLLVAWWILARAETRLRPGLEPDDVDTYSAEPVDEAYLNVGGRNDRRRGWHLFRRGLLIGALLIPAYGLAVLLPVRFAP